MATGTPRRAGAPTGGAGLGVRGPGRAGRVLALLGALAGCGQVESPPPPPLAVVDSVRPIAEAIRSFAATLDSVPGRLHDGAPSREELVRSFLEALAQQDTATLTRLTLSRGEFLGVYYPTSPYTAPPYELEPGLVWFQLENASSRGLGRLLARFGGRPWRLAGVRCPEMPEPEGSNRLWRGCRLTISSEGQAEATYRMFGAILERDGRWKFLGYANDF